MKIPYAALRFSNAKTNLGLNFMREIKRDVQNTLESVLKLAL
jgi:hypothetical protein